MKIVVDTNVLISGIFFSGPPARILRSWRSGGTRFVICPEIMDEYTRVAEILKKDYPDIEIDPILTLIFANSEIAETKPFPFPVCEDPDDDKFLACALCSNTGILVSGDKHLLKLSGFQGITIITPRVFVDTYLKHP